jgi:hypothetical protein
VKSLILIFVTWADGTRITLKEYIVQRYFVPLASLIFGLSFSLLLYIVSYLMYCRKWFIRI